MASSRFRVVAGFGWLALLVSCTLTQGIDEYGNGGSGSCPVGQKYCGETCRSKGDPEVGCAQDACTPCGFDKAATAGCDENGACRMGTCFAGYTDCNLTPDDGCEVNTDGDPKNCGGCGKACPTIAGAVAKCVAATCSLEKCATNFGNCDGEESNGCEVDLASDPQHCGKCEIGCNAPPKATAACKASACAVGVCDIGYVDCNSKFADGCECGFPNALAQCGTGGLGDAGVDASPSDGDAEVSPDGGGGACTFARCRTGFDDCNKDVASDGCEVNLQSDENNCGRCGKKCAGGKCIGGTCQPFVLAADQPSPGQIIFDGAWVYWTNFGSTLGSGSVMKVRNDGLVLKTVAPGQANAWGVGEYGTEVFWTTWVAGVGGGVPTNIVGRAPKEPNASVPPKAFTTMNGRFRGLAVDPASNYVYFGVYDGSATGPSLSTVSGIYRIDRVAAGAQPELFANAVRPNSIVLDTTNVYWTNEGPNGSTNGGSVAFAPKASAIPANPTLLASGLNRPRGLALDGTTVFWSNAGSTTAGTHDGSVEKILKTGAPAQKVTLAAGLGDSREIALDDGYVYWTSYRDEVIARISKTATLGAPVEILAQNPAGTTGAAKQVVAPLAVAVDNDFVYWSNYGAVGTSTTPAINGSIMRLVKP